MIYGCLCVIWCVTTVSDQANNGSMSSPWSSLQEKPSSRCRDHISAYCYASKSWYFPFSVKKIPNWTIFSTFGWQSSRRGEIPPLQFREVFIYVQVRKAEALVEVVATSVWAPRRFTQNLPLGQGTLIFYSKNMKKNFWIYILAQPLRSFLLKHSMSNSSG